MKIPIYAATIGAVAFLGFGALTTSEAPVDNPLKANKADIVSVEEYEKDGVLEVFYSYKNGKNVDDAVTAEVERVATKEGLRVIEEIKERRGGNVRVFATDTEETVYEFVAGPPQYYKDKDKWYELDYATTTKESFDKQTNSPVTRFIESVTSRVLAQTFYPNRQGTVARSVAGEDWATIRGGAGTSADTGGSTQFSPFVNAAASSNTYSLHQFPIFPFDTDAIPDTDVVSSATFSVVSVSEYTSNGDLAINISDATATNPIAAGNYESTVSAYTTTFSTDKAISAFTSNDSTYNDFVLNAAGIANIEKAGPSESIYSMRFAIDISGSGTPTWSSGGQSGIEHRSYNNTGTSKDPKLVVVTAPAATPDYGTITIFD